MNKPDSMVFGDFLRQLRVSTERPQREVAEATGIDQTALSRIESGVRLPTEEQLESLAQYFNVPRDDLATRAQTERQARMFDRKRPAVDLHAQGFVGLLPTPTHDIRLPMRKQMDSSSRVRPLASQTPQAFDKRHGEPDDTDDALWESEDLARTANDAIRRLGALAESADPEVAQHAIHLLSRLARRLPR